MKKFVHIFEGQIVCKYEATKREVFGGPWASGESVEVDSSIDLKFIKYEGVDEEGKHIFVQGEAPELPYEELRRQNYPDIFEYIDGVVKNDKAQIDAYIQKCKDVKAKFPKPKVK